MSKKEEKTKEELFREQADLIKEQLDKILDLESIESAVCIFSLKGSPDNKIVGQKGHFYDNAKLLANVLREYKDKVVIDLEA